MRSCIYGYCPFCVRIRIIFSLRDVEAENITLANDDEDAPIDVIGVKQVPIPEEDDGMFMGEGLDIVHYIDETVGKGRLKTEVHLELQAWLDKVGEYNDRLAQPRLIKIDLFGFATESAVQYFIDKKERSIDDFETSLSETAQYLERLSQDLAQLGTLTAPGPSGIGGEIGMEDILASPILRNLTTVRGIQ